jgi:hypothetical protein
VRRIARAVYTLRNKRNISHKGEVDPNTTDLAYIHQAAAWIMSELIRSATGITMEEAGTLIELVQAPVGTLIEDIDGVRLVHANGASVRTELLVLLRSRYPDRVPMEAILASLSHRGKASVQNRLGELRQDQLVHGDTKSGFRLTRPGYDEAEGEWHKLVD